MTILTAVDGKQVPSRTVQTGYELATQFDEPLVVVHVMSQDDFERQKRARTGEGYDSDYRGVDPETGASAPGRTGGGEYTVDQGGRVDAENVARHVVEESLDEWSNVSFQGHVGDPVDEILGEARRRDARYVVIGGRRRTPIGKAVFGSTVQSMLLNSKKPVLTVPGDPTERSGAGPVVAAVDRSSRAEHVVREAARLASGTDRPLHVVHALTEKAFADSADTGSNDDARAAATSIAEESAMSVDEEYTAVGLVGEPSKRLVEYCEQEDAGFIVTAGRKRTPVGKVLFGSVTQSIILNVDCPVLTTMVDT